MIDIIIFGASAVAITMGVTETIKRIGCPIKFIPVVSLAIGLVVCYVASNFIINSEMIIGGLAVGLSSSGLYSGVKKTILNK